jgi:hypothetical protein
VVFRAALGLEGSAMRTRETGDLCIAFWHRWQICNTVQVGL